MASQYMCEIVHGTTILTSTEFTARNLENAKKLADLFFSSYKNSHKEFEPQNLKLILFLKVSEMKSYKYQDEAKQFAVQNAKNSNEYNAALNAHCEFMDLLEHHNKMRKQTFRKAS